MNTEKPELPEKDNKLTRHIAYLFHAYTMKTITDTENDELDKWICASRT